MLPFTPEQFIRLFADYNRAVWPVQVLAYLLGLSIVIALPRSSGKSQRVIGFGLASMWAWTGIAYHLMHFSSINRAALIFGVVFVVEAGLLFHATLLGDGLRFERTGGASKGLGWLFVFYAMLLYPLVGWWSGHSYPGMPMFGITPCPVTLFTVGVFLLATTAPWWLLVIPLAWSLVGASAAFLLAMPQDWPLLLGGVAILFILRQQRGSRHPKPGTSLRPR
jgi:hypothetical protein